MGRRAKWPPAITIEARSGQARVRHLGKTHYLGRAGSAEAVAAYAQLLLDLAPDAEFRPPCVTGRPRLRKKARAAWYAMIRRCHCERDKNYGQYGARGVWVCERYRADFENFLADVGLPPDHQHSLDRIDNAIGYCCGRCEDCAIRQVGGNLRWATWEVQSRNKSNTILIKYGGRKLSLYEWGKITGIAPDTIRRRIQLGWPVEKVFSIPVGKHRRREKAAQTSLHASAGLLSEFWH